MLGFLIPFSGIGNATAVIALTVYALLPMVRNTHTGITNVDPVLLEAAKGMGSTKLQILLKIKLPLAMPIIISGIRNMVTMTIALAGIASFIGAGGLGYLVYAGIRTTNTDQILAGAIPACLLALLIDYIFSILERTVTPKSFQLSVKRSPIKDVIDELIIVLTCFALAGSFIYTNMGTKSQSVTIKIGSMDFSEQETLNYMLKYLIEGNTDVAVEQALSLGSSSIVLDAINGGSIDMYVDYTGTIYGSILGLEPNSNVNEVYDTVKKEMQDRYQLTVLEPLGFNNTYTLAMRKDTAKKYNIETISDLCNINIC